MLRYEDEVQRLIRYKIFILCWLIGVGVKDKEAAGHHGVIDTSHKHGDGSGGEGKNENEKEEEEEYLESDMRMILLTHLRRLGLDAYIASDREVEEGPYYSYYFTSIPRIVTSVCCIKVNGMNFDCINLLARG